MQYAKKNPVHYPTPNDPRIVTGLVVGFGLLVLLIFWFLFSYCATSTTTSPKEQKRIDRYYQEQDDSWARTRGYRNINEYHERMRRAHER